MSPSGGPLPPAEGQYVAEMGRRKRRVGMAGVFFLLPTEFVIMLLTQKGVWPGVGFWTCAGVGGFMLFMAWRALTLNVCPSCERWVVYAAKARTCPHCDARLRPKHDEELG